MSEAKPRRGEVWWTAFSDSEGGEIQKTRPAVIVSNNAANENLNRVQLAPLTTNVAKLYPGEAYVSLNGERRKVMADQIATASKARLRSKAGDLSSLDMTAVDRALRVQLAL